MCAMGKRSWLFIALVALVVTISYAEEAKFSTSAKANSVDDQDKPLKKDADLLKWVSK